MLWNDGVETAFNVEIYASFGAPTTAGTYPIDADEADYSTCSLCIIVVDGVTSYMPVADSGSITLTDYELSNPVGSTFTGSLDLTMQEVTIDGTTLVTTPVAGGCTGTLIADWTGNVIDFPAK